MTPTTHAYSQGRILLGIACPEGWCLRALDPVDGYSETLASFRDRPVWHPERELSWAARRLHDPGFGRVVWGGGGDVGWMDRAGNITAIGSKVPRSEFESHDLRFGPASFDTSGNYWLGVEDRTARLWTVYRVALGESSPLAVATSKVGVEVALEGEIRVWRPQPYQAFHQTRSNGSGCHEPNDVDADGRCVGIAGFRSPQHVAVLDPYKPAAARIDGIDRYGEMFAIRGRALTADSALNLRHPVFSPDGSQVAFISSDRGAKEQVRLTGAGEPRMVPGVALANQDDHLTLLDWLP